MHSTIFSFEHRARRLQLVHRIICVQLFDANIIWLFDYIPRFQVIGGDFERRGYSTFSDHGVDNKGSSVGIRTLVTVSGYAKRHQTEQIHANPSILYTYFY